MSSAISTGKVELRVIYILGNLHLRKGGLKASRGGGRAGAPAGLRRKETGSFVRWLQMAFEVRSPRNTLRNKDSDRHGFRV